jgi:two-component system alkaline phosphatase synthesis response regulator PhoP
MQQSSILIVSDEPATGAIWGLLVKDLDCTPLAARSAAQAVEMLVETAPDLIVVDVTQRATDGIKTCAALHDNAASPILLLTPVNNETYMLEAYAAGVDECVIKPVSPALFLAKVKVWLRRSWTVSVASLGNIKIGELTLEPARRQILADDGRRIRLSQLEFRLLHLLMNHPGRAFQTDELIERIWGFGELGRSALVKNVIYRLRKKIEPDPNQPRYIRTETGGYLFRR